jgi:hypothetical protein
MGHNLNEHGLYESDLEDIDFLDLVDVSREPYQSLVGTMDEDVLQRLTPFLSDLQLFVKYIFDNMDFKDILRKHEHKIQPAWRTIMEDEKRHT